MENYFLANKRDVFPLLDPPDIMMFSFSPTDIKLGITCRDNQKIYMVDNSGNVSKGFPLTGTTKFSIAVINKKYCILTGGNDNFIYNYQMP